MKLNKALILGLRVFAVTARTQSVTKAAEELNVTPGAVSQQIRQVEESLGTKLFHRAGGRLALNEKGRLLATEVDAGFQRIQKGVSEVARRVASDSLRVKLSPTLALHWLLPRLASFYSAHPDIQLEISTYISSEDGTLDQADLVIRIGNGKFDEGDSDFIFFDETVPVCSPAIARRLRKPADLLKENLLHSMIHLEAWSIWLRAHRLEYGPKVRSTKFAMAALAFQAARKGLGVALAQTTYVRGDLLQGSLVVPFEKPVRSDLAFYLVYDRNRSEERAIKAFRGWVASTRS